MFIVNNPYQKAPKGDRSEGFYIKISILIDVSRCWVDFIEHNMIYMEIQAELIGIMEIFENDPF